MDQNFSLMAQSRANYYSAGSPVLIVRVELLKGDTTGEVAVCLTFKNVGTEPLTGLVVHFKCKDAAGQVLCEDDFYYEQLNAQPGAVFGSDDAVYVSDTPVSSVEVEQDRAVAHRVGEHQREPLASVLGLLDLVGGTEDLAQHQARDGVVVDDQDGVGLAVQWPAGVVVACPGDPPSTRRPAKGAFSQWYAFTLDSTTPP